MTRRMLRISYSVKRIKIDIFGINYIVTYSKCYYHMYFRCDLVKMLQEKMETEQQMRGREK